MEDKIENIIKNLHCTREQAIQIIQEDESIEKGEKLFELNDEQKKNAKMARQADRKPGTKRQKREKKVDNNKQFLIQSMVGSVLEVGAIEMQVTNPEREFTFIYEGVKYKIVMSVPRK